MTTFLNFLLFAPCGARPKPLVQSSYMNPNKKSMSQKIGVDSRTHVRLTKSDMGAALRTLIILIVLFVGAVAVPTHAFAADRFWVGGTGNWSDTARWSTTSGGAGGASVPTSADNAIFDANSNTTAYTVTVNTTANMLDLNFAAAPSVSGTITWAGNSAMNIYGSMTLLSGMTKTYNGNVTFNATTGGKTLTFNGVSAGSAYIFGGVGGGWVLQDTWSNGAFDIRVQNGTLNTNDQTVTANSLEHTTGTATLTLGSSLITLTSPGAALNITADNLTLNAGTSVITFSGNSATFNGRGLSYYNVNFTSSGGANTINNVNTFNNLTFTPSSAQTIYLSANQTINGTLTLTGSSASARLFITSNTVGTARTITAAAVVLTDVDFTDITGAGAASPFTGTRLGNATGNSGITFTAATNKFWVGNTNNWNAANVWALTTGGAGATNNFPLPQDTAIFDDAGLANGNTVTVNAAFRLPSIDWSTLTRTGVTFATTNGVISPVYGSITLNNLLTINGGSAKFSYQGRNTQTITSYGVVFNIDHEINSIGGTVTLADAFTTAASRTLTLTNGTLNMNGKATSVGAFDSSNSNTRSITSGGATLTLTGNNATIWIMSTATGFTLNDALQIDSTYSGSTGTRTMQHGTSAGGTEVDSPSIKFSAGTDIISLSSGGKVKNLDFTGFAGTFSNNNPTIFGNLTISTGMTASAGAQTIFFAATSGTKTITSNGKTLDFPITFNGVGGTFQLADAMTVGSTRTLTLTNGTFNMNGFNATVGVFASTNSNTRTLTLGTGTLFITGNNGSPIQIITGTGFVLNKGNNPITFSYSGPTGTRALRLDGLTAAQAPDILISAGTDSIDVTNRVGKLDFTGFSGTWINNAAAITIGGDITISTGMTVGSGGNVVTFATTTGTQIITSNGKTLDFPITFNGIGGTFQLADPLTLGSTRTLTLTNGTFDMNGKATSVGAFDSSNSNTRSITSGGATLTVSGVSSVVFSIGTGTGLTLGDTLNILASNTGSGNRQAKGGDFAATANINFSISGGSGNLEIGRDWNNINLTNFVGTFANSTNPLGIYGNMTYAAGATYTAGSNATTFKATSGTQTITSNGKTLDFPIIISAPGATVQLADAMTVGSTRTLTLTNGTFDMNGKAVSTGLFSSSNSNTRSITSGGATMTLTGSGTTIFNGDTFTNFTLNDSLTVALTYSGGTGTRAINLGGTAGGTAARMPTINVTAGTDIFGTGGFYGALGDINFTGFSGTWSVNDTTMYGGLILSTGMTYSGTGNTLTFVATSGTKSITTNGKSLGHVIFDGIGGTWQLADALTLVSTRTLTLTNGTLDLSTRTLSTGRFASSNSNTRALTFGAGSKLVTTDTTAETTFNVTTGTNLTVNRNGGTIEVGGNTTNIRTFAGGGKTWPALTFTNGTAGGELDFTGSNTFKSLSVSNPPQTLKFTAGTTNTIEDANGFPSGTAGNLITIGSITAASHTLTKSGGGKVLTSYLSISRSTATPATTWYAANSVDGGNNSGWTFALSDAVVPTLTPTNPNRFQLKGGTFRSGGGSFQIR